MLEGRSRDEARVCPTALPRPGADGFYPGLVTARGVEPAMPIATLRLLPPGPEQLRAHHVLGSPAPPHLDPDPVGRAPLAAPARGRGGGVGGDAGPAQRQQQPSGQRRVEVEQREVGVAFQAVAPSAVGHTPGPVPPPARLEWVTRRTGHRVPPPSGLRSVEAISAGSAVAASLIAGSSVGRRGRESTRLNSSHVWTSYAVF